MAEDKDTVRYRCCAGQSRPTGCTRRRAGEGERRFAHDLRMALEGYEGLEVKVDVKPRGVTT